MAINDELFLIHLEDKNHFWAGVINGCPFAGRDDEKVAATLKFIGFEFPGYITVFQNPKEFLAYAESHPVLSQVPDWAEMGIQISEGKNE